VSGCIWTGFRSATKQVPNIWPHLSLIILHLPSPRMMKLSIIPAQDWLDEHHEQATCRPTISRRQVWASGANMTRNKVWPWPGASKAWLQALVIAHRSGIWLPHVIVLAERPWYYPTSQCLNHPPIRETLAAASLMLMPPLRRITPGRLVSGYLWEINGIIYSQWLFLVLVVWPSRVQRPDL
jgi:hypothetical protein